MPEAPDAVRPVVRFAPSPTGRIHLGNLRTALLNWAFAERGSGTFILRFDDTDRERSRDSHADGILADLRWIGIEPDRVERQSARLAHYGAAAERLRTAGRLYAAYDTPEELERQRRIRRAQGLPPVYDRRALRLGPGERAALESGGRPPHWRFRLPDPPAGEAAAIVAWDDGIRGMQSIDLAALSDPVLVREDGTFLYTLTSVVDDVAFGVTDVIRGEDHVTNTAVQIALFRALDAEPPRFAHHGLLVAGDGEGLSKRRGALSVAELREGGLEPLAVAAYAALIGTSAAVEPVPSLRALAMRLDDVQIGRAPAHVSVDDLRALNHRQLAELPFPAVAERLADLGVGGGEPFWHAIRGNIATLSDAGGWWFRLTEEIRERPTQPEEADYLALAATLLPPEPWDSTTFASWMAAVKAASGRKGKALFGPIRLALTGLSEGPELAAVLPFLRRQAAADRLAGSAGYPARR